MRQVAMLRVVGKYGHICSAVGRFIDEHSAEFHRCRCFQPTRGFLAYQDAAAVRADLNRGQGSR